jgi:hypothetical protein
MAAKPKTFNLRPKTKAKSKKQKEQSGRFIEIARELGVDESGKKFEAAVKKIVPTKR